MPHLLSLDHKLVDAYRSALAEAARHGCRTVGFCLLSAGVFRGARPLRDIVELAVRSLAHALTSANDDAATRAFDHVTLVGYTPEERALLAELGAEVASELASGGNGGGEDPQELFVDAFDVSVAAAKAAEAAALAALDQTTAAAMDEAQRMKNAAERAELEKRAAELAAAQSALQSHEDALRDAQADLDRQAGCTADAQKAAEAKLQQVQDEEKAARERMKRETETLQAAVKAAEAAAMAQKAAADAKQAEAAAQQAKADEQRKAAEATQAKAAEEKHAADAQRKAAAAAKVEAEKAASAAKAEADRAAKEAANMKAEADRAAKAAAKGSSWFSRNGAWSRLADGAGSLDAVKKLFAERQPNKSGAGPVLQIESAVCINNEQALGSFRSAGRFARDPLSAVKLLGGGDTLLFHGTNETAVANIQASGRPTVAFSANGMLGKGIYGAPDPRKSLQYTRGNHGKFMFVCRFNLKKAKHAGPKTEHKNSVFDEFCVYDDAEVVVLWMLKLKE